MEKVYKDNEVIEARPVLYRDDLICATKNNGFIVEKTKKKLGKIFEAEGFKLADKFNISQNSYKPYAKENCKTKYVDKQSDHPYILGNNIPKIIEKRIGMLPSDNNTFQKEKDKYIKILNESGYKNLQFDYKPLPSQENIKIEQERRKKNAKKARQIAWFNPPYTFQLHSISYFWLLHKFTIQKKLSNKKILLQH